MAVTETSKVSFVAPAELIEQMQRIAERKHLKLSDEARAAFREYVARYGESEKAA